METPSVDMFNFNNFILFNFFVSDKMQTWGRAVLFAWKTLGVMWFTIDLIEFKIRIRYNANHHFLFFSDLFLNYLYLAIVY